jgi:hypothetical protein
MKGADLVRDINSSSAVTYQSTGRIGTEQNCFQESFLMLRNRKALHVPSYSYNKTIDNQKKTREETGPEQKGNSYKTVPRETSMTAFAREKKITHNKLLCFSLFSPPSRDHRKRRKKKKKQTATMRTYEKCRSAQLARSLRAM